MSAKEDLQARYAEKIVAMLGCCDRVMLSGTLTGIAHPAAMAGVLRRPHIRCFDLEEFVEPLREAIRENAERIAAEHRLRIEQPMLSG